MKKRTNSILFYGGTLGLIVLAIGFTALLNRAQSPQGQSTDIRAKAGVLSTLHLTGVVSSVDIDARTIVVENLSFVDSKGNLGTWTVTAKPEIKLSGIVPGKKVTITVDSDKFQVSTHTLTATDIK